MRRRQPVSPPPRPTPLQAQYLPLSTFVSKPARDHLAGGRPPPPPARRGPPEPGSLTSYRAAQAAGWKPNSERYRAAYLARSNMTALGGVPTVYAEPKPGLLANGKHADDDEAAGARANGAPSALLFFHGGAYMFGDPRYMAFAYAPLAAAAGARRAPRSAGSWVLGTRSPHCPHHSAALPRHPASVAIPATPRQGARADTISHCKAPRPYCLAPTNRLCSAPGMRVYAPDYRKAPEHRFPAALDDALAAYKALLKTYSPARVAVAGARAAC